MNSKKIATFFYSQKKKNKFNNLVVKKSENVKTKGSFIILI